MPIQSQNFEGRLRQGSLLRRVKLNFLERLGKVEGTILLQNLATNRPIGVNVCPNVLGV